MIIFECERAALNSHEFRPMPVIGFLFAAIMSATPSERSLTDYINVHPSITNVKKGKFP